MKILVTGGAGFIGSAATARFLREGHEVVVVDSFNKYYDPVLKRDRVAALIPSVPVYFLDITNKEGLSALFKEYQFDAVRRQAPAWAHSARLLRPEAAIKIRPTNVS